MATVTLRLRDAMGLKEVPKTSTGKIQKFQLRDRAKAAPKIA
jgi:acyl-coenzyme A synthetase/AMP-(fatty) acid ligase